MLPTPRSRRWICTGAILGALAVILGAFGAHGLEGHLDAQNLEWWGTGAHYHLIHAGVIVCVGLSGRSRLHHAAGASLTFGVLVFSGTLYLLALTGIRWLGAITPLGGLGLIGGWILLAIAGARGERTGH